MSEEGNDPQDPFEIYNEALECLDEFGDYDPDRGVELLKKAAKLGDHHAMAMLAQLYGEGELVEQDKNRAFKLISRAVEIEEDPQYLWTKGFMMLYGEGTRQKVDAGVSLIQKASDDGCVEATTALGVLYLNGDLVGQDVDKAIALLEKSAEADSPEALHNLGFVYDLGEHVGRDVEKAVGYYRRAVELGNPRSAINLAMLVEDGDVEMERDEFMDLMDLVFSNDMTESFFHTYKYLSIKGEAEEAEEYLQMGIDAMDEMCLFEKAVRLAKTEDDFEEGLKILIDLADRGYEPAIEVLEMSEDATDVPSDDD